MQTSRMIYQPRTDSCSVGMPEYIDVKDILRTGHTYRYEYKECLDTKLSI